MGHVVEAEKLARSMLHLWPEKCVAGKEGL